MKQYLINVWDNQVWFSETNRTEKELRKMGKRLKGKSAKSVASYLDRLVAEIDLYNN